SPHRGATAHLCEQRSCCACCCVHALARRCPSRFSSCARSPVPSTELCPSSLACVWCGLLHHRPRQCCANRHFRQCAGPVAVPLCNHLSCPLLPSTAACPFVAVHPCARCCACGRRLACGIDV